MASSLEDRLITLSDENDWHGIVQCSSKFAFDEKTRFLWAWPTVECLMWLKSVLRGNDIENILSIGCGSGLLEWLIDRAANVNIVGLELDKSWWQSSYAPKKFIDIRFTQNPITSQFLRSCLPVNDIQFALLFCYFNNRNAFLGYVRAFDGDLIIIIGPMNKQIVTEPNPLNPNFEDDENWMLVDNFMLNDQNNNCIGIYKRIKREPNKLN